ncbi:hypothetical protein E3N88_28093 [Mikania micrantha]|uniref:Uncharacterized protein n=1 Tax=Mikania micrantha TaxID=192012 RepID=A0A5N6N1J1_9ASTR|nr:hypothetical protein E3N88_28093 [Mikania micrantha]
METRTNSRLDAQDVQIKQLQNDVLDIKASLQILEDDRAESVEFRKVVLAWMKHQEKQHTDGSSGSGFSGNFFSNSGLKQGLDDSSTGVPWAVKKVKLPEFTGFDPQGWITKANLYFDINNTNDPLRLRLAQLSMVGVAQHWFTILTQVRDSLSWTEFQSELLQRFSGLEIQNPYEQLANIQQSDSIHDYIDDFEYLLSLVPRLPETQALGYFVAGLKADVKKWVRLHRPQSRLDAMYLAKDVEQMLRPNSGNVPISRFRYLNRFGPYSGDGLTSLGSVEPNSELHSKPVAKSFLSSTESSRLGFSSKSASSASVEGTPMFHKDRGVRSLSRTEWEERRKKGLCFRCGLQYSPTHKCAEGTLRVLLLGEDEYDTVEGTQLLLEDTSTTENVVDTAGTCLAMELHGEIADSGGAKTLRFEGSLNDIPVSLLVDSGASHNFISRRLVLALGLTSVEFSGIRIKLGDSHIVFVTQRCLNISVKIGTYSFFLNALVFDMGSLDLILGMEWLKSLGVVVHDWQQASMTFIHQGMEIQLKGLATGQSSPAALQQWLVLDELVPSFSSIAALSDEVRCPSPVLPLDHHTALHLAIAQNSMKVQADKKRRDVTFAVGEWVYVKLKPYRQMSVANRIHQKLAAKFFGLFQIIAKIGLVVYKLQLPASSKIHSVFHVSLLKKVVQGTVEAILPPEFELEAADIPLPIAIIATRFIHDGSTSVEQWLVQWHNQSREEDTWEDAEWVRGQFPDLSLGEMLT